MNSLPPSEQITKVIEGLMSNHSEGKHMLSELMKLGLQKIVQEALEAEVSRYLGRDRYERADEDENVTGLGWRNGYKDRSLRTAEGRVPIKLPQVRNSERTYRSELWPHIKGNSENLENLVIEMYARGLSTRDIEAAFTDPETEEMLLSRSQVSHITEVLWEEYEAFAQRDLSSFDMVYLFFDAVYEPLRRLGRTKEALLCCWGVLRNGSRVLIHIDVGHTESYESWKAFIENLVNRGLPSPITVTSDGHPGLIRAIRETWCETYRIRCWAHKMRNVISKVPEITQPDVRAHLTGIRDAADWATGRQLALRFIDKYRTELPRAVASFENDLEASLAHLRIPAIHRRMVRTTNLIERAFVEERRRTKVIPRFMDEKSGLKLAFATLWRVSQNWSGARFSEHEFRQLEKLATWVRSSGEEEAETDQSLTDSA